MQAWTDRGHEGQSQGPRAERYGLSPSREAEPHPALPKTAQLQYVLRVIRMFKPLTHGSSGNLSNRNNPKEIKRFMCKKNLIAASLILVENSKVFQTSRNGS